MSFCNAAISSVTCDADFLPDRMVFVRGLPKLAHLRIRGNQTTGSTVGIDVLGAFGSHLKKLELVAGGKQWWTEGLPEMIVEDLRNLLLPWGHALRSIHLVKCDVSGGYGKTPIGPNFFSSFPSLEILQLVCVRATPALNALDVTGCTKLWALECVANRLLCLDLTGCRNLKMLACWANELSVLDLSSCTALEHLSCEKNALTALKVSICPNLMHLGCARNKLRTLSLANNQLLTTVNCTNNQLIMLDGSACPKLKHLDCGDNPMQSIFLPGLAKMERLHMIPIDLRNLAVTGYPRISDLHCTARTFQALSPRVYAQLKKLNMPDHVTWELAGFKRLDELTCKLGPLGSINLTGCQAVELNLSSSTENLPFVGRSAVRILRMGGVSCLENLSGFSNLTELHHTFDVCNLEALDLSVCSMLRRVVIENKGLSTLAAINFTGCLLLQELRLIRLTCLTELDLSSNIALIVLRCVGSSLACLDVSCCSLLESGDVSDSPLLVRIHTGNTDRLRFMTCNDCPRLQEA